MAWASLPIQVRILPSRRSAFKRQDGAGEGRKRTNERFEDPHESRPNASLLDARCTRPPAHLVLLDTLIEHPFQESCFSSRSASQSQIAPGREDALDSIRNQDDIPVNHLPVLRQHPRRIGRVKVVDNLGTNARIDPQLARLRSQRSEVLSAMSRQQRRVWKAASVSPRSKPPREFLLTEPTRTEHERSPALQLLSLPARDSALTTPSSPPRSGPFPASP